MGEVTGEDLVADVRELAARVAMLEDHGPGAEGGVSILAKDSQGRDSEIHVHYDKVLIKRAPEKSTLGKDGTLVAADQFKERPFEGEVLAVGNGRVTGFGVLPLRTQVGDWVTFGRYSGTEVDLGGETFLVLREDEILVTIRTLPGQHTPQVEQPPTEPALEPTPETPAPEPPSE